MKKCSSLVIIGLCGLWASTLFGASAPAAPPAKQPPSSPSTATKPLPAAPEAVPATPLPPALAESIATEKAIEAHIRPPRTPVPMGTPPPALRPEKKFPAPAVGLVWVPGHWRPVEGRWQWTPGEWATPATPASVWMDAGYDPKTKQWTAGYWQPDRAESYETDLPLKETPPAVVPK